MRGLKLSERSVPKGFLDLQYHLVRGQTHGANDPNEDLDRRAPFVAFQQAHVFASQGRLRSEVFLRHFGSKTSLFDEIAKHEADGTT
jgi:hypothetical protein